MKKILILIIVTVCCFYFNVEASDIILDPVLVNDKYILNIYTEEESISYEEAIEKYNLDEYLSIYIDGENRYFYLGNEIDEETYLINNSEQKADKKVKDYGEYGYRVQNSDDIIKAFEEIYASSKYGNYYLVYSTYEKDKIDFDYIREYYLEKYATGLKKNMYKYNEYGYKQPIRFFPLIGDTEIIVNYNNVKITSEEEKKVDKFLDYFLKEFEGKNDYEKILGIYTYISNTAKYVADNGYESSLDALHSVYDVLIKREMVCIGAATTFQYLAEKLNIDSYIVDHVAEVNEKENSYITTHTYNVVKLDGKWYILDIVNSSLEGFLIGYDKNKYDYDDFSYYNLKIENKSYLETNDVSKNFIFDYDKYDKIINEIQNVEEIDMKEAIKDDSKKDDSHYVDFNMFAIGTLIVILVILSCIIYLYVRR